MIARVRPKYCDTLIAGNDYYSCKAQDDSRLYFSSGASGVAFFVSEWNRYYGKKMRVGIQSLTCQSMADAILRAGCEMHLFDVEVADASIHLDSVKGVPLDMLILTSYQGLPAIDYEAIARYCINSGILFFEDLAHGCESYSESRKLGSLSNLFLESYCWDKPYAAINGGSLFINSLDDAFHDHLRGEYNKLPVEQEREALDDCKMVEFGLNYTNREDYNDDCPESYFFAHRSLVPLYNEKGFARRRYRAVVRNAYRVLNRLHKPKRNLARLHPLKIAYINSQRAQFKSNEGVSELEQYLLREADRLNIQDNLHIWDYCDSIEWNRYSALDSSGILKKHLRGLGVCCDNYNWPCCLHDVYSENRSVVMHGNCEVSSYISKNVVNIPIWYPWWLNSA